MIVSIARRLWHLFCAEVQYAITDIIVSVAPDDADTMGDRW
jgi:hypothetical protein